MKIWTDSNNQVIRWELEKDDIFPTYSIYQNNWIVGIRFNTKEDKIIFSVNNSSFLNKDLHLSIINTGKEFFIKKLDRQHNKNNNKISTIKYYITNQVDMDYVLENFLKNANNN